jgi:hypothetical protein
VRTPAAATEIVDVGLVARTTPTMIRRVVVATNYSLFIWLVRDEFVLREKYLLVVGGWFVLRE